MAIGRGEGSKIQNCQRIVLKNCQHGGGGCQKSGKIADIVYGWSQIRSISVKNFEFLCLFSKTTEKTDIALFFAIMFGFELALHWTENKKEWWSMTSNVLLLCLVFSLPLVKPTQGKNQMLTISSGIFTIFPHTAASDANSLQF